MAIYARIMSFATKICNNLIDIYIPWPLYNIMPNEKDDRRRVEEALEKAIEARDYPRIREILKSRGLGVSKETATRVSEDVYFSKAWGSKEPSRFDNIEIAVTPEEYEYLSADFIGPPEPCHDEPSPEMAIELEAFRNQLASSMPAHLEKSIQQEDADMLTGWLRFCGYSIFPRNLSREDEPSADAPEPPGCS
jgi:hypothetical protein